MTEAQIINSVKFKIAPTGVEFEASGSDEFVEREREKFNEMIPPITRAIPAIVDKKTEAVPLLEQKTDLTIINNKCVSPSEPIYETFAEFIIEKKFSLNIDLILAAAYYLSEILKQNEFTCNDIETLLREDAKEAGFSNISVFISSNIKKSRLYNSKKKKDGKKAYCISRKGITYCEEFSS